MATAGLQLSPSVLEVQNIVPGTRYDFVVQVKNNCQRACRVRCIPPQSAEWTVSATVLQSLAPGLSAPISVSFTARKVEDVHDLVKFQYFNQATEGQVQLELRALAPAPQLQLSHQLVDFGRVVPGSTTSRTVTLTNTGRARMDIVLRVPEGEALDVSPSAFGLEPAQAQQVRITCAPLNTGMFRAAVTADVHAADLTLPHVIDVAGTVIEPSIFIMDAANGQPLSLLDFGAAYTGGVARRRIVLVNNSPSDVPFGVAVSSLPGGSSSSDGRRAANASVASEASSILTHDDASISRASVAGPYSTSVPTCSPQTGILRAWEQQEVEVCWKLPKAPPESAFAKQAQLAGTSKLHAQACSDSPSRAHEAQAGSVLASMTTSLLDTSEVGPPPSGALQAALHVRRGTDVQPCASAVVEISPVPPKLSLSQQHFSFGVATLRKASHIVFTVHNDNTLLPMRFEVQRAGYFACEPTTGKLAPGESTNLLARYQPGAFGVHRSQLTVVMLWGKRRLGAYKLIMQGLCEAKAEALWKTTSARTANMPPESHRPKVNLVAHGEDHDPYGLQLPLQEAADRMRQQSAPVGTREYQGAPPAQQLAAAAAARKPAPWERSDALIDLDGGEVDESYLSTDRAKYTYSIRDLKALTAHRAKYSDFVVAARLQREDARSARREPELIDDAVLLNDDPKRGLAEPQLSLPPAPTALWMSAPDAAAFGDSVARNRKLSQEKLIAHKYKPAPTTQAEMRDFAMMLNSEELQLIDAPCNNLDFGTLTIDSAAARNFAVSNRGRSSIVVSIRAPNGVDELARCGPASQVIPPGGTAGFDIHLDARRTGDFEATLTWSINDKHSYRAQVRALVVPRRLQVDVDRMFFRFPTNSTAPELVQRVYVKNPGSGPVHWRAELAAEAPYFLRPAAGEVAAGESLPINIVYRPRQGVDPSQLLTLQVLPHDADSRSHSIALDADSEDVQLSLVDDTAVNFGALAAGTHAEKRVLVQNQGSSVAAWSVVAAPGHLDITPMDGRVLPGDTVELEVRLDANATSTLGAGAQDDSEPPEHIVLSARGGHTLRIPVLARVVVPDISITAIAGQRVNAGARPAFGSRAASVAGRETDKSEESADSKSGSRRAAKQLVIGPTLIEPGKDCVEFGGVTVGGALRRQLLIRNDSIVPSQVTVSLLKHPQFFIEPLDESNAAPGVLYAKPEHTVVSDGRALHRQVSVHLQGTSCLTLGVLFLPSSVRSHSFKLPASVPGLLASSVPRLQCAVRADGLPSRLAVSDRVLDFQQQVVPTVRSRKFPYSKTLSLTNVSSERLTWEADLASLHSECAAFTVSPSAGTLDAGEHVVLNASFLPSEPAQALGTLPFYLNDTLRLAKLRTQAEAQAHAAGMAQEDIADAVAAAVASMGVSSGSGEESGERPHLCVEFVGAGIPPQLSFDCAAVTLPPVPLHTTASAEFHIVNSGFDHLQVRYTPPPQITGGARTSKQNRAFARDVAMPRIPLAVEFPQGSTLSLARQRIPVVVHFTPNKSMGFTVPLTFEDGMGGSYSIPVTAVADNSLLTNFPFVADHLEDHVLFVKPYSSPLLLPAEAVAAKLADDVENSKSTLSTVQRGGAARNVVKDAPSPQRAVGRRGQAKRGAGQGHGNLAAVAKDNSAGLSETVGLMLTENAHAESKTSQFASVHAAATSTEHAVRSQATSQGGQLPFTDASRAVGDGQALSDIETVLPWLNSELFTVPVEDLAGDLAQSHGKPLWDAVESMAGASISGRVVGRKLPADNQARIDALLKHHAQCLAFLRARGGLVHTVAPQDLLAREDYVLVATAAPGVYAVPRTAPVLQYRTPQAVDTVRAQASAAWPKRAAEAWLTACMQVVRVFLLQRVSLQTLVTLPGMELDGAAQRALHLVQQAHDSAREDALQDEANGGRNKSAAAAVLARDFTRTPAVARARRQAFAPDALLAGSNVMSTSELLLARWLEWHHNHVVTALPRRIVDFSRDLQDGVVLAAVILRHAPHLAEAELSSVRLEPLTRSDMEHNLAACMQALKALDLEPPFVVHNMLPAQADGAQAVGLAAARQARMLASKGGEGFHGALISPDGVVTRASDIGSDVSVPLVASAQLAATIVGGVDADPAEAEATAKLAMADAERGSTTVRGALWATHGVLAHSIDCAVPLSGISQRFGLLVALWLFTHLPGVIPRESLQFDCVLGAVNEQVLEVSNDSDAPLVYKASLVGHSSFSLAEHKVAVPPQGNAEIKVRCKPLRTAAQVGRLILHGVRQGGQVGQTLVFTLRALVARRTPVRTVRVSTPLYQACTAEVPVQNLQPHQVQLEIALHHVTADGEPDDNVPRALMDAQRAELSKLQQAPVLHHLNGMATIGEAVASLAPRTAAAADSAASSVDESITAAFFMRTLQLTLKSESQRKLPVQFFPRALGTSRAVLSYILPKIGEQVIELVGEGRLPAPQASLVVTASYKQELERDLKLPWRNAQACEAELALLQRLPPAERIEKSDGFRPRLTRGELLPVRGPDAGKRAAAARGSIQYAVECDSPYVKVAPTLVLRQGSDDGALDAAVDAQSLSLVHQSKLDSGYDDPAVGTRSRAQVQVETPRAAEPAAMQADSVPAQNALRFTVQPPAPGKFPVQILLHSKYDVRLVRLTLDVTLPQVERELELRSSAGDQVSQNIPLVNNTATDWQFAVEYRPAATHWTLQDEGAHITEDVQTVLSKLVHDAEQLQHRPKFARSAQLLSDRAEEPALVVPKTLTVPAQGRTTLPITWQPRRCGVQAGVLQLLPLNSGSPQLQFQVRGTAGAPAAQGMLERDLVAQEPSQLEIELENWAREEQTVLLGSTLSSCHPPDRMVIKPAKHAKSGPARSSVTAVPIETVCAQSGRHAGAIVAYYVNSQTWRWWTVQLSATRAASAGQIDLQCFARSSTTAIIPVQNDSGSPLQYSVRVKGDYLSGDQELTVPAHSVQDYELRFDPWAVGTVQGSISFYSQLTGELWYTVRAESQDPPAIDMGMHPVPIGLTHTVRAELVNPLPVAAVYDCVSEPADAWQLEQTAVEVPAHGAAHALITYSPTAVGKPEPATITCRCARLAPYVINVRGSGVAPGVHPTPVRMSCVAGSSGSGAAHFRNPFSHDLDLHLHIESHDGEALPFSLLKRDRIHVAGKAAAQIPLSFTPSSASKFAATLVVAAPRQALVWQFPLEGVAQCVVLDNQLSLRSPAREPTSLAVTLPLLSLPVTRATRVTLEMRGHSEADSDWFAQFVEAKVQRVNSDSVDVTVECCATKPGAARGVLVATVEDCGGEWVYDLQHHASAPEPDDTLVLQAALGRTATLQLALNNQLHVYTPFCAWLTVDSAPEFSVSPSTGMLAPVTEAGTKFTVTYMPREYGRPARGILVVETADMQWSYALVGRPPRWRPPQAEGSRLDNQLPANVLAARTQAARARQGSDFIRSNVAISRRGRHK